MKKKLFVLVLALAVCCSLLLAGCSHTHTFSEEWTSDDTHHWHAATCEHTSEVSDKAAHTWDNGVITTPATHTANGVKTYTCTVCGKTKTESVSSVAHDYDTFADWAEKPTLTEAGTANMSCECGATSEISVPALSDETVWTKVTDESQEPTCADGGKGVYTSEVYGKVETVLAPTGEHTWKVTQGATTTYTRDCAVCGERRVLGVEEARAADVGEAFYLNGIIVGIATTNSATCTLVKDLDSDALISVRALDGTGISSELNWGIWQKGDIVELPVVRKASAELTSTDKTTGDSFVPYCTDELPIEELNREDWVKGTATAEQMQFDFSKALTIDNQADFAALINSAEARKGTFYQLIKLSGVVKGVTYGTAYETGFVRFFFDADSNTGDRPQYVQDSISPVFKNNNEMFNTGKTSIDLIFGQTEEGYNAHKGTYGDPLVFTGDIYCVLFGGNQYYAMFSILDASWVQPCEHENVTLVNHTYTCTEAGEIRHYHCADCGGNFADETCTEFLLNINHEAAHSFNAETHKCDVCQTIDPAAEAQVGETVYLTFDEAVVAAANGGTVVLLKDLTHEGISVPTGTTITIDLNGFTYTVSTPGAGSPGTETQGLQLLKDSTIVIKNGTINVSEENLTQREEDNRNIKMLIQNYSDLTLENVTLDGTNLFGTQGYVLSNNNGNVLLKGETKIIVKDDAWFAFDACDFSTYTGVTVTVESTVDIGGKFELSNPNGDDNLAKIVIGDQEILVEGVYVPNADGGFDAQHILSVSEAKSLASSASTVGGVVRGIVIGSSVRYDTTTPACDLFLKDENSNEICGVTSFLAKKEYWQTENPYQVGDIVEIPILPQIVPGKFIYGGGSYQRQFIYKGTETDPATYVKGHTTVSIDKDAVTTVIDSREDLINYLNDDEARVGKHYELVILRGTKENPLLAVTGAATTGGKNDKDLRREYIRFFFQEDGVTSLDEQKIPHSVYGSDKTSSPVLSNFGNLDAFPEGNLLSKVLFNQTEYSQDDYEQPYTFTGDIYCFLMGGSTAYFHFIVPDATCIIPAE